MNIIESINKNENFQNFQSLKIGEIFLEEDNEEPNEITLKFNCDLCELTTENFQLFFKHIKLNHIKNNDVTQLTKEKLQKYQKYMNCLMDTRETFDKTPSADNNLNFEESDENIDSNENFNFTSDYDVSLNDIDDNAQKLNNRINEENTEENSPEFKNDNATSLHISHSDYKLILEENESMSNIEDSNSYIDSTEHNKTFLRISFQTDDSNGYVFEQSEGQLNTEQDDELCYEEVKLTDATDMLDHQNANFIKGKENGTEFEYEEIEYGDDIIKVKSHQSTYEKFIEGETYKSNSNQESLLTVETAILSKNLQSNDENHSSSQHKDLNVIENDSFSQDIEFSEPNPYNDFIEEDPENDDSIELMEIIMGQPIVGDSILNQSNQNVSRKSESICDGRKSSSINNAILYECNKCNKIFPNSEQLILHRRVHGSNKLEQNKTFQCYICSKIFNKISNWKSHLAYHSGERNYPCSYPNCQQSFIQNNDRKKHERRVHLQERNHTCDVCAKKFYIFSELREHKRIHDPNDKYECTICGAKFNSKRRYQTHRLTHENKNGSYCSYCNINFASVELLKGHFELKHFSKLKVQNKFCKICEESFKSIELFERHCKLKHDNDSSSWN